MEREVKDDRVIETVEIPAHTNDETVTVTVDTHDGSPEATVVDGPAPTPVEVPAPVEETPAPVEETPVVALDEVPAPVEAPVEEAPVDAPTPVEEVTPAA